MFKKTKAADVIKASQFPRIEHPIETSRIELLGMLELRKQLDVYVRAFAEAGYD